MHSFVVQNLPEFIKSNPLPTAKNPPMTDPLHVSEQDWGRVETLKERADSYLTEPYLCNITVACCLVELRDRVVALEAAGDVAGNPGHASAAPAGVAEEELADCLPANVVVGPYGYNQRAFARHLLDHPRIGPLLRGEGAPAPKRVVLPEAPPKVSTPLYWNSFVSLHGQAWQEGYAAGWATARAEVERQQGGQADG